MIKTIELTLFSPAMIEQFESSGYPHTKKSIGNYEVKLNTDDIDQQVALAKSLDGRGKVEYRCTKVEE